MGKSSASALGIDVIVYNVLKYLSCVELLRMQVVCKLWQNNVQQILTFRNKLILSSSQHQAFQLYLEIDSSKPKRKKDVISSREINKEKYLQAFIEWRNCWRNCPDTVLLISPCLASFGTRDANKQIYSEIRRAIPNTCRLVMLTNTGVGDKTQDGEFHYFNGWALSPRQQLTTSFYSLPSLTKMKEKTTLLENLECHLKRQTNIKLLMIFVHISSARDNNWLADTLLPELKKKIFEERGACILGAILNHSAINNVPKYGEQNFPISDTHKKSDQFFSYMISGENVSVSSIVVQCQSWEHEVDEDFHKLVDEKLSHLKQSVGHKKALLKFVVSCCAQQGNFKSIEMQINGNANILTPIESAFNNKFPNVPTLSLTSSGEIGFDFNLIGEQVSISDIYQQYSSIFTVVSLI